MKPTISPDFAARSAAAAHWSRSVLHSYNNTRLVQRKGTSQPRFITNVNHLQGYFGVDAPRSDEHFSLLLYFLL
jgi:hypothetical protein